MRGYFKHDLMHFVVEKRIHAEYGFFGQIARGMQIEDMSTKAMKTRGVAMKPHEQALELIVATLQKARPTETNATEFVRNMSTYLAQLNIECPNYLSESFVRSTLEEFNEYVRRWETLRHGGVLTLSFA